MFLAIDVGNTNTVIGCFDEETPSSQKKSGPILRRTWRVSTHPICTADELRIKLASLQELDARDLGDARKFDAVVVSSVVPPFTAMLRGAFSDLPLHVIDHRSPFSFVIKADPPSQVGADRLVNAEAAVAAHGAPVIIVDSGTATTICAVSRAGEYLGGAIMPGIELSVEALAKKAAKLFTVELVPPSKAIGANTSDALKSGLLLGYASMIDGMVTRFKKELKEPGCPVVATGGVSQLLQGLTTELTHFDTDLTLKGIARIYEAIRSR